MRDLIDQLRDRLPASEEKRMFGGTGFLEHGHLLCSVSRRGLLVRVGPEAMSEVVAFEGVEPMTTGGRTSKGWVRVDPGSIASPAELSRWVERAESVVRDLDGH